MLEHKPIRGNTIKAYDKGCKVFAELDSELVK
jgi:hypothetical protein